MKRCFLSNKSPSPITDRSGIARVRPGSGSRSTISLISSTTFHISLLSPHVSESPRIGCPPIEYPFPSSPLASETEMFMTGQNPRHRNRFSGVLALMTCLVMSLIVSSPMNAQQEPLQVTFGDRGPTGATYQDQAIQLGSEVVVHEVKLTDTYRHPHEEIDPTSLKDAPLPTTNRRVGMREYHDDRPFEDGDGTPNGQSFDRSSRTLTQQYDWGVLRVKYRPVPDGINMSVRVNNTADQVIERLSLELMSFQPPGKWNHKWAREVPGGDYWIKGRGHHFSADTGANIGGPRILRRTYEGGQVVLFSPSPEQPLSYRLTRDGERAAVVADVGHLPSVKREVYDRTFNARPIRAGSSDSFDVTLRFGTSDADPVAMAQEALRYFREQKYPRLLDWPDRRPIAATFVSGKNRLRDGNPNGYRMVPRGWSIEDENAMETFRKHVIEHAEQYADRLVERGYQGVVVWNVSGERYQSAKYYGEPRLVEYIAPEMDRVVDDYFRILREHGLRVGVTIRPVIHSPADRDGNLVPWENIEKLNKVNHGARQIFEKGIKTYLNPRETFSGLARLHYKIKYAKERWGATMFYIDYPAIWRPKTPDNWGHPEISPAVYRKLKQLHPDILLMPEDGILASWSVTAPYGQVRKPKDLTPERVRQVYPDAFSVRAFVKPSEGHKEAEKFAPALRAGDVPMSVNQYKVKQTFRYLRPIQSDTPYLVRLGKNKISLRGPTLDEVLSLSGTNALRKTFANRLSANAPVVDRRVRIRFNAEVAPGHVRKVVEAIGKGNGIVTWSEPVSGNKSNN